MSASDPGRSEAPGDHADLATLAVIARALGRNYRAFSGESEPWRYRDAGPRLLHRPSGLRFCLVPRGASTAAFLIAEAPLSPEDAAHFSIVAWSPGRRILPEAFAPLYLEPEEIARVTTGPFRLPSDAEWDHALMFGATTTFYWGDEIPSAPPALPHPLGLAMPAWWDELTAEGHVRGGGAALWPWEPDGRARERLAVAHRRVFADEPEPRAAAVRLALSLEVTA